MTTETAERSQDEVRCLGCHAVYELPLAVGARDAPACPDCGGLTWVAATIPVPQTERVVHA